MLYAPVRLRVERDVIVRIRRHLLGKGAINVSIGSQVSPSDIIGTAQVLSGFRIINISQTLGISPKDTENFLKRKIGERIFKGELLAEKVDVLGRKKIITSPNDGTLEHLNEETGDLRITFLSKKVELPAGVFGIVEDIDKIKGRVIIKTQASIVHGMFGTGRVRDGILHLVGKRDQLIDKSFSTPALEGKILVGGSLVFKDTISSCISNGVSGIITGGINSKEYKGMAGGRLVFPKKLETEIGISLVVCEGFGSISIGSDIYEVLSEANGKFTTIDGNSGKIFLPSFEANSLNKIKSTVLPPISQDPLYIYNKYQEQVELKKGSKVRVIGNTYAGEQGNVIAVDNSETVLASGIRAHLVTIETQRRKIQVPVANLEVIDYSF